ncbi:MAG: HNH endonuclease [Rhodospirillales bacterium]|nr:HNH endonuclease [Rhodospirillales bacterium]
MPCNIKNRDLTFQERVDEMSAREPNPDHDYYSMSLSGDADGNIYYSVYSEWEGFADEDRRIELRSASLVFGDRIVKSRRGSQERCVIVDDLDDFDIFFFAGGHAVIEKGVAESVIGDWLKPKPVIPEGSRGFSSVKLLPQAAMNRAPTPKTRMKILKRDGCRCRICGRSASDNVDVELHVHHIRPWAKGGLSVENNLITLCHTCHKGLDPHFDSSLYGILEGTGDGSLAEEHAKKYWEGVRLYRENLLQFDDE